MTIEERLVAEYGLTDNPECGVWLLKDGRLVNGSYDGRQRDVDHSEICRFFRKPKGEMLYRDVGPYKYVAKFMRRGNIRWGCSGSGLTLCVSTTPTIEQLEYIVNTAEMLRGAGIHSTAICAPNNKWMTLAEYMGHLARYTCYRYDAGGDSMFELLCMSA